MTGRELASRIDAWVVSVWASKVGIALEEMEESWRWLRLLNDAMDDPPADLAPLIDEARQLTAILAASHQTARRNRENHKPRR